MGVIEGRTWLDTDDRGYSLPRPPRVDETKQERSAQLHD